MAGRRRVSTHSVPEVSTVRIERIGAEGDGVGRLRDGTPVYIAGTLPGEVVLAAPERKRGHGWAAHVLALKEPSAERVNPACVHFGVCGGCALQHWAEAPYLAWKSRLLRSALEQAGFTEVTIGAVAVASPGTRRRMDLAVRREPGGVIIGLHQAASGAVVDVPGCVLGAPELMRVCQALRPVLSSLSGLRREGSVLVTVTEAGADVLVRTDAALSTQDRMRLTAFAQHTGVSRVSWAAEDRSAEPVCVIRPPTIRFGEVVVSPPPGAFLQATVDGETAIVQAVLAGLPRPLPAKARIGELYAGCGTLTFPLASRARVIAWEGDGAATAALWDAARKSGLAGRVEIGRRDLARQPLLAAELRGCAAVVLDPPFSGAAAQMRGIAEAGVARVIYVSCNPAALGRDASVLQAAGYRVLSATPVDQFLWSSRLESVTIFERT